MYHLFIFDSTLCIFYNYPLKLTLAEIVTSLPCSEEIFEATSGKDCLQGACLDDSQQLQPSSLKEAFAVLVGDDISAEAKSRLVKLAPFHLFILIHSKLSPPLFPACRMQ
jgi:hypothetical protein